MREGEVSGWEGGNAAFDLVGVVAKSIAVQAVKGWLSKTKAWEQGGTATAVYVRSKDCAIYPNEAQTELAREVVAYFAALENLESLESLERNANVICNAGFCSEKSYGLAVALPVCYRIAMDKKARAEKASVSEYLWAEGDRVKGITATVKFLTGYEGGFGYVTITILEDENGNVIKASQLTTKEEWDGYVVQRNVKQGDRVKFTATVKQHTEYNGTKQTVVARPAKVEILTA